MGTPRGAQAVLILDVDVSLLSEARVFTGVIRRLLGVFVPATAVAISRVTTLRNSELGTLQAI